MRKKLSLRLCIYAGVFLLIAQSALLTILIYGDKTPAKSAAQDISIFLNATLSLKIPIILLDAILLEKFLNNKLNCIFCKIDHPVTFAALYKHIKDQQEVLQSQLESVGFSSVVLLNTLPPEPAAPLLIRDKPTAFLIKSRSSNTVIHLVLLHEREADFWWHGSALSDFGLNGKLLSMGIRNINELNMMSSEGAYDKFEGGLVTMDDVKIAVPKDIPSFLEQRKNSKYIECSHSRAAAFHEEHGIDEGRDAVKFRHRAWKLLSKAKTLLDEMKIPFWLSSGTCLGYFRQCDIISYSKDVDLGIMAYNYQDTIIPKFTEQGLKLKHWFGQLNDSLEISFVISDLKLDLFFFYEDDNTYWNGGTQAKSGLKFKYKFPKFTLCWTEFLDLKVRVPCETQSYIQANYGTKWDIPQKQWDWKSSPANVKPNGQWPKSLLSQVIRLF